MDKYKKAQIAFMEATIPIFKALTDVKNRSIPKITMFPDGKIEYEYTEEVKKFEDKCFREINRIKQSLMDELDIKSIKPDELRLKLLKSG